MGVVQDGAQRCLLNHPHLHLLPARGGESVAPFAVRCVNVAGKRGEGNMPAPCASESPLQDPSASQWVGTFPAPVTVPPVVRRLRRVKPVAVTSLIWLA